MATNPSGLRQPEKSNLTAVPYPSPPSSPLQTGPQILGVPKAYEDEACPAGPVSSASPPPPRAPPQQSVTNKADGNKHNVSELKSRLNLDGGLCGGLTKKRTPCKHRSPPAAKSQIISQLGSILHLTQSAPELRAALDKLATLVHCRLHDSGAPKESRVDAWIRAFPVGESDIDPTVSIATEIRNILPRVSTQCIVPLCGERIGGQRVQNCVATIAKIVRPEVYQNDTQLGLFLKILETNMFCREHIDKGDLTKTEQWKSEIEEILRKLVKPTESALSGYGAATCRTAGIQISGKAMTLTRNGSVPQDKDLSMSNTRDSFSKYWPAVYDTSPLQITEDSATHRGPQYARVKRLIIKPLNSNNPSGSGYVYAYTVQGNPQYVKIGYTTDTVEERLKEWEFDCNRAPTVLYPMASDTVARVSNVRRVEALCHAELSHRRVRIDCKGCLKPHLEWFKVSAADAIAAIQKWSKWMATEPYQFSVEKWELKPVEQKRIREIGCFMKEISKV
ncbi:hypothetical protein Purlil1_13512 [Purpureocillium lilacinum]|uniref:Bacteriophage T5 Orf172 DNA-binding domain-containing protein n=1 Tax=Purpureocillium lilacinum TaxID=33203 RepID=A0ABR0BDW5_PURLI|nr:hypothetical protein Purlil1_13512 [Purpureocillium lilacinum]